jgi:hypothetical protein
VFARIVTMRLKPNTGAEFTQTIETRILPILRRQKGFRDEMTFVAPGGTEAVGISLWDQKEQAEAYNSNAFPEVLKELAKLVSRRMKSQIPQPTTLPFTRSLNETERVALASSLFTSFQGCSEKVSSRPNASCRIFLTTIRTGRRGLTPRGLSSRI